jgi:hypothetical protein
LDEEEMKKLIADLSFVRRGHRNVPDEEESDTILRMKGGQSSKKYVKFDEFKKFVKETSIKKNLVKETSRR